MAKIKPYAGSLKGSLGEITYRQTQSGIVMYPKVHPVPSHTKKQLYIRCRMGNICNFNRAFNGCLTHSFEDKVGNHSSYNMLLKYNTMEGSTQVYLTRLEARQNACVVAPYVISMGSLPTVGSTVEGEGLCLSDLSLGDLDIDEDTTVGEFTLSLMAHNPQYEFMTGDEMTFFCIQQDVKDSLPCAEAYYYNLRLDASNEAKLWSAVRHYGFHNVGGRLGSAEGLPEGGYAWVLTRHYANGTYAVSSERLACDNPILASYTSEEAFERSAKSYGGYTEALLRPDGKSHNSGDLPMRTPSKP